MFVISDKIDKEMCPTYETLKEEKSDEVSKETSAPEPTEPEYKRHVNWECECNGITILLVGLLSITVVVSNFYIRYPIRVHEYRE